MPATVQPSTIHRTYQVRAYTDRAGYERLDEVLRMLVQLYNAGLEEWQTADRIARRRVSTVAPKEGELAKYVDWITSDASARRRAPLRLRAIDGLKPERPSITRFSQYRELTAVREADPDGWGALAVQIGRGALKRLDLARQAFYRRVKAGQKPGYPRWARGHRYHTIEFSDVSPAWLKETATHYVLRVKGLPEVRIRKVRALPPLAGLKALRMTRRLNRLTVDLTFEEPGDERQSALGWPHDPERDPDVGIDMGVTDRVALSTGERVPGRSREHSDRVAKLQQRHAGKKRGSRRWRKAMRAIENVHARDAVANRNDVHRLTTRLVREHDRIAIEELSIGNMTRSASGTEEEPGTNVAAKSGLNRSVLDQTWGVIATQLAYKAEWAGRELVSVDPRFTSQTCSVCGVINGRARSGKLYHCTECDVELDADVNAAINIRERAFGPSPPRASHSPRRSESSSA